MGTMLLSIGDGVEPGHYELHSRFERACNFTQGERLVCVVDASIGAGPLNIVLARFHEFSTSSLHVGCDNVIAEGRRCWFSEGQRYHSALRIGSSDTLHFRQNLSCFGKCLVQTAPAASLAFLIDGIRTTQLAPGFAQTLARELARSTGEFFHGDMFAGIAGLQGCGPGLTPSGDDFLAGVLTGLHVVQQIWRRDFREVREAIFFAATGHNLFSNNFLEMARRGMVSEHVQTLIAALGAASADQVVATTRKLLAVGSTSGADFATGLYMAIRDRGGLVTRYEKRLDSAAARISSSLEKMQVGACS